MPPRRTLGSLKVAILPAKCIKCNGAIGGGSTRVLWRHHPAIYLLVFLTPWVYIKVAELFTEYAAIRFGMCKRHRRRYDRLTIVGAGLVCGGFLGIVALIAFASPFIEVGLFAMVVLVSVGSVCIYFGLRTVAMKRVDRNFAWLRGAGEYLEHLPPFSSVP